MEEKKRDIFGKAKAIADDIGTKAGRTISDLKTQANVAVEKGMNSVKRRSRKTRDVEETKEKTARVGKENKKKVSHMIVQLAGTKIKILLPDGYERLQYKNPIKDAVNALVHYIKESTMEDNMPFDYKKENKEFYMPKNTPSIVTVPRMNYIAVRVQGDPKQEGSEYKESIGLLYGIAFTIKMSKKGGYQIKGYFDYVVPPLEGFWWQEGMAGIDYDRKKDFKGISVIRLPDFVTRADFDWAIDEAGRKKGVDFSKVELLTYEEGLCVQCMHIGPYDEEPATVALMHEFMKRQGYRLDISDRRMHHEIYLSDVRKTAPEKVKTVVRHPIAPIMEV